MPPVQASSIAPTLDGVPYLLDVGNTFGSSFGGGFSNSQPTLIAVLTGLDITATQANPVQCFAHATLEVSGPPGAIFYWDSQSTGEGDGVWFSWRGALPIMPGAAVQLAGTAASSITWGWVIHGYRLPLPTAVLA